MHIRNIAVALTLTAVCQSLPADDNTALARFDHPARTRIWQASFQQGFGLFSMADDAAIERFLALSAKRCNQFYSYCPRDHRDSYRYKNFIQTRITPGSYNIPGVDRVIMINLDRRPEKLKESLAALSPYSIVPDRLSAVDGKLLGPEVVSQMGVQFHPDMLCFMATRYFDASAGKQAGKCVHEIIHPCKQTWLVHCTSRMQFGCYLSHLSAIWDAYWSGAQRLWMLEDDIQVVTDPHQICTYIDKLESIVGNEGWDALFTDMDHKTSKGEVVSCSGYTMRPDLFVENDVFHRKDISEDFIQYGSRYGTHSYIISRAGMEKIIAFSDVFGMFAPIDFDMCVVPGIRLFAMKNPMIETTSMVHD
ncbi:MAG: glycosyltransferase family 25 protein [Chlamydiia bacterium]